MRGRAPRSTPAGYTPVEKASERLGIPLADLLAHLESGDLPSHLLELHSGKWLRIDPSFWRGAGARQALRSGHALGGSGPFLTEGYAFIKASEIENVLAGRPAVPVASPGKLEPNEAKNKGGPPRRFSSEDFLVEAARLVYFDGLQPKSQAEFREAALTAFANRLPADEEPPSDEWAKPLIRKLWNRLELGKPG